jgi:hypothetical protein
LSSASTNRPDDEEYLPTLTPQQEAALRAGNELLETPLETFTEIEKFHRASELLSYLQRLGREWAFRGHARADWHLRPSIERLQNAYSESMRLDAEEYVRRTFSRRAHHYLRDLPAAGEDLEWLALMRHHGAPTRLLDWTKSPYVATFFAVADATEKEPSAVWAINIQAVKSEAVQLLVESGVVPAPEAPDFSFSDRRNFRRVVLRHSHPAIVAPMEPVKMNERVTSQQGLFLCANHSFGFEIGLKQVLKSERERYEAESGEMGIDVPPPPRLIKLNIDPQARIELLQELHRMNINYATLFPGLDGFARSLATNVTLSPSDMWDFRGPFDSLI